MVILRPDEKGSSWERFDDHYQPPEVGFGIRLTREILRDIAQALRVAANRSASEIEKRALEAAADTLPAWTAQQRLLLRLGEWARDFGLLYGPYYNGEVPSKFSEFVCALLQMAPEGYREKALTAGAVAERIRRVRKEAGAKKREQLTRAHGK
ncbi:hypothetical protein [Aminobacter niigataensis]|uniref:hypothetical protein n=1 Tax=Aminobacter niigataensis TaxID=83265 RepID=UPI00298F1337|nr:hypothetical protein [Aminobacter niigataensis]